MKNLLTGHLFCVLFSVFTLFPAHAQENLLPGSLAVTGYNSDNPDAFSLVALDTLPADSVVMITDNGWNNGTFRSTEGTLLWTLPDTGIPPGTIVLFTLEGEGSVSAGSIAFDPKSPSLSASGDQLLLYRGSAESPVFLFGFNNEGDSWQAESTSSNESALPTGLVTDSTALAVPETDNIIYTGPRQGIPNVLLASLCDPGNWEGSNSTRQELNTENFVLLHASDTLPPLLDTVTDQAFCPPTRHYITTRLTEYGSTLLGSLRIRFTEEIMEGDTAGLWITQVDQVIRDSLSFAGGNALIDPQDSCSLILKPQLPLEPDREYYLLLPEGFVTDTMGNPFAGISPADSCRYKTAVYDTWLLEDFSDAGYRQLFPFNHWQASSWHMAEGIADSCVCATASDTDTLWLVTGMLDLSKHSNSNLQFTLRCDKAGGRLYTFYSTDTLATGNPLDLEWYPLDSPHFIWSSQENQWITPHVITGVHIPADSARLAFMLLPQASVGETWCLDNIFLEGKRINPSVLPFEQSISEIHTDSVLIEGDEADTLRIGFNLEFTGDHHPGSHRRVAAKLLLAGEKDLAAGSYIHWKHESILMGSLQVVQDTNRFLLGNNISCYNLEDVPEGKWVLETNGFCLGEQTIRIELLAGYEGQDYDLLRNAPLASDSLLVRIIPDDIDTLQAWDYFPLADTAFTSSREENLSARLPLVLPGFRKKLDQELYFDLGIQLAPCHQGLILEGMLSGPVPFEYGFSGNDSIAWISNAMPDIRMDTLDTDSLYLMFRDTQYEEYSFRLLASTGYENSLPGQGGTPGEYWMLDTSCWYQVQQKASTVAPLPFTDEEFRVFPNPSGGSIRIQIPGSMQEHAVLELRDITGRLLRSEKVAAGEQSSRYWDLKTYPPGIYFLSLKYQHRRAFRKILLE